MVEIWNVVLGDQRKTTADEGKSLDNKLMFPIINLHKLELKK